MGANRISRGEPQTPIEPNLSDQILAARVCSVFCLFLLFCQGRVRGGGSHLLPRAYIAQVTCVMCVEAGIYEDYVWMSTPAKSTKEEAGEGMGSDGGVEVGKQSKFIEIQV